MKRLVVLSGAGVSAESGISTFRDAGGLWEGHDIMEVASPAGFESNPELVLDFYNKRRAQLKEVSPNDAHYCIAGLERNYQVNVITQNVDDLHERAGSNNVLHLHGELLKARSSKSYENIIDWDTDIKMGDTAIDGSQLRPHIVWFGEDVPAMEEAIELCSQADIIIIVGTSLQVYPAAGLMHYAPRNASIYYVDPSPAELGNLNVTVIAERATKGIPQLAELLYNEKE